VRATSFVSLHSCSTSSPATFFGAIVLTLRAATFSLCKTALLLVFSKGLRLELTDIEAEKLGKRATDNAEAWEEYLRGRDNFGRFIFRSIDADDCDAAMANFKRAIELDPHFALAYSGLGACYANRVFKGLGEPEDYTYAEAAFSKAFFYDQNVVEARVLMVMIYMARGEKKKARSEIELLQKQFPNDAALYFVKGVMHRLDGEYEESLKAFEKLSRLDPAARAVAAYNRARIFIYKREFDKAQAELDRGFKVEPNHPMLRIFQSGVHYYEGKKRAGDRGNGTGSQRKSAYGRHQTALRHLPRGLRPP
jgi:tetratricopeptide (TPR) repeat protein